MIVDRAGREFRNLRVSLTAACNYACTYCVPPGEKKLKSKNELGEHDLIRAIELICRVTRIDRLRITGGEPLIAPLFDSFLRDIKNITAIKEVSITTNGEFLSDKIQLISDSGIKRINVSLDSTDAHQFNLISKGGNLNSVVSGIEAALSHDISVKINMVPVKRYNIDQIVPMLELCMNMGVELRYIELMRMGHLSNPAIFDLDYIPANYILQEIAREYEFVCAESPYDSTSKRYYIPSKNTYFGVIANESLPFCSSCTRLRLSSSGHIHGCLSNNSRHYVADILDLDDSEAEREMARRLAIALGDKQSVFKGTNTIMRVIGG